ncbi:GtrA family protein [Sulfurirhabdus autotrophica]|uniref:Putative flippase GtrA n=1 Tax=Sulfurirhabdus autotrophica TaxID=1706046 RepID=A0A4R3YCK6_9PROT|nr:GtrA family protein [Sulfurirhabdus autotrophica]TCV88133.1 putative flippase GtrA [Sulfurirhabdus autotrophica]
MQQFFRFIAVGSIGFAVDAGIVFLLVYYGISPILARFPAIASAVAVTWLLNRQLTFRVNAPKSHAEAMRYVAVAFLSAGLNFALYSVLVLSSMRPVLAVGLSTFVLMFFSFVSYKRFVFAQTT